MVTRATTHPLHHTSHSCPIFFSAPWDCLTRRLQAEETPGNSAVVRVFYVVEEAPSNSEWSLHVFKQFREKHSNAFIIFTHLRCADDEDEDDDASFDAFLEPGVILQKAIPDTLGSMMTAEVCNVITLWHSTKTVIRSGFADEWDSDIVLNEYHMPPRPSVSLKETCSCHGQPVCVYEAGILCCQDVPGSTSPH